MLHTSVHAAPSAQKRRSIFAEGNWELYLLLLPALLLLIVFKYIPMNGVVIAFQDYNIFEGILGSSFTGFENFKRAFDNPDFYRALWNTLFINFYKLCFYIPLPILIALMLNEVRKRAFRSTVQTIIYLPHFLSWIIVGGIFVNLLSVNTGMVNDWIRSMGLPPVKFMYDPNVFPHVIIFSSMWKEIGWGAIVYLAALSAIDPQLYEAARMDGASRLKQILHITIPSLSGTIVIVTLTSLGNVMNNSFEQILVMYNPAVYEVADVLNTYVYRQGIGQMEYGYSSAIGLFNSVVSLLLVVGANMLCKKFLDRSLW